MSTCNFSLRYNSDFLYAFCESSDFDAYLEDYKQNNEIDEEEDDFSLREALYSDWYEDEKDYYLTWLEEELNKLTAYGTGLELFFTESGRITDGDEVAEVRRYFNFAGGEFMISAAIDFEAGYYEGFALDWRVKTAEGTGSYWHSSYDDLPDSYDCENMLEDETELNAGLRKALAPKLAAKFEKELAVITGAIEKALKTISPYHLTGVCASNGEGFYTNHREQATA